MAAGSIAPPTDAFEDQPTPSLGPVQGAPSAPGSTPTAPAPIAPAQPGQQPNAIQQGAPGQKGTIQTGPATPPEYDPKKLAKANNALDLLNAMKPKSRTDYMDWWEKQHGDIDDKYDNLKKQIGARPADDEPQSKTEKLAALVTFGLHLMKNSAGASTNQGAVALGTLSDETDANNKAHADLIAKKQKDYDESANAIESGRQEEQKGIGTPAQAQAAQSKQNLDYSAETRNNAQALKAANDVTTTKASSLGPATYSTAPDGTVMQMVRDEDGKTHAEPVTGIDGKPYKGKVLGRTTGSGIDKGDTAQIRNHKYLSEVLGVDEDTAAHVAFKAKSGNPAGDHKDVYKALLTATMDPEKAKRGADQYVLDNYGAHAIPKQNAPLVSEPPPATALSGLKPGMVRDFGAKGQWTVGIDGKPTRVAGAPTTLQ
jgi:hypothetical protein